MAHQITYLERGRACRSDALAPPNKSRQRSSTFAPMMQSLPWEPRCLSMEASSPDDRLALVTAIVGSADHFALTLLSRKWHSQSPPEECSKTPLTRHR